MSGDYEAGAAAFAAGDVARAIAHFEAQLAADPRHLPSLVDLGVARAGRREADAAIGLFERALALAPGDRHIAMNLANTLATAGRGAAAEAMFRRVLELAPDDAVARHQLGSALLGQGRYRDAMAAFATAIACSSGALRMHCWRSYLNMLHFSDEVTPEQILAANMRHAAEAMPVPASRPAPRDPDPCRKLRVGYVSSDFRMHSVARNMAGIFTHRDRANFEVHVYAELDGSDEYTETFRRMSDGWTSTVGMDDAAAAARIAADGIDVLVLTAGHFDRNRAGILFRRPAPVQISIYDVCTLGSDAIDAIILDPAMVAGRADRFVERPLLTRHVYVHPPPGDAPPTGPAPCIANGHVTFGSANNPVKMAPATYDMWAAAMKAVPGSRLRLRYLGVYADPAARARVGEAFAARGIEPARIDYESSGGGRDQHLKFYASVDVTLDTFPFTGSTTTFEALWMGVPVVTRVGTTVPQRWTAAMLARVHREEWCASDVEGFARIAARLAAEAPHQDRAALRATVAASSLCDLEGQARAYERLYRAMWARACRM
ncbi:MAG: tetratricopeptide repeat protein [Rhodospirillales bacterium]|nr:tetratricopeptide repeat protein [Rhodospirillales bacterium]